MLKDLLLGWYDLQKRSFPWRERVYQHADEHAYHTWVCEVMSQQTLLSVLLPKYEIFLIELPNIEALYNCSEEKLRYLWKGLGYYARARNLQLGARYIVDECKGVFPRTQKEWEKVPGCGAYTSAIIASICYGENIVAIDGNVIRVASRLLNLQDETVWTPKGCLQIFQFLQNHVSDKRPGDFNQALMDLGATVCKKHEPNCIRCPLQNCCLAKEKQTTHLCPPVKPRRTPVDENLYVMIVRNSTNKSQIGVIERTTGFLKKTVGFPLMSSNWIPRSSRGMTQLSNGMTAKVLNKTFKHSITHHKIVGSVVLIEFSDQLETSTLLSSSGGRAARSLSSMFDSPIQWVDESVLKNTLSSSLDQKAYKIFNSME